MASQNYAVGYKKPPKKTQFKKGNNANPNGRGAGTKNLKTDLREELNELMPITENGKSKLLSKQRVLIKSLMAKAVQGDARAANSIITLAVKLLESELVEETANLSAADQEIFAEYVRRLTAAQAKGVKK